MKKFVMCFLMICFLCCLGCDFKSGNNNNNDNINQNIEFDDIDYVNLCFDSNQYKKDILGIVMRECYLAGTYNWSTDLSVQLAMMAILGYIEKIDKDERDQITKFFGEACAQAYVCGRLNVDMKNKLHIFEQKIDNGDI